MIEPGDRVIVEQPSYDRTLLLLDRIGAELVGGAARGRRARDRRRSSRRSPTGRCKLAHVIPNFHNPAGCTLSDAKRDRLVELAAEHGFWIFEDDPYRLISFGDAELPPTMLVDRRRRREVIHASSFSKTVSPGVRVGYLVGPAERDQDARQARLRALHLARTCSPSRSCSSSAARARSTANIEFVNDALAERRDALVSRRSASRSPRRSSSSRAAATSSGSTSTEGVDTRPLLERRQGGGRRLRRRPRLHARGRRVEPAALLRERSRRPRRRGRRADRPGPRPPAATDLRPPERAFPTNLVGKLLRSRLRVVTKLQPSRRSRCGGQRRGGGE